MSNRNTYRLVKITPGETTGLYVEMREDMNFEVYWDGACGADKIQTFAPMGVKGFVLGTTLLFGKEKSYSEILKDIRELKF